MSTKKLLALFVVTCGLLGHGWVKAFEEGAIPQRDPLTPETGAMVTKEQAENIKAAEGAKLNRENNSTVGFKKGFTATDQTSPIALERQKEALWRRLAKKIVPERFHEKLFSKSELPLVVDTSGMKPEQKKALGLLASSGLEAAKSFE